MLSIVELKAGQYASAVIDKDEHPFKWTMRLETSRGPWTRADFTAEEVNEMSASQFAAALEQRLFRGNPLK